MNQSLVELWHNDYSCDVLFQIAEKVAIKILDKTKLDQKTQRLLSREISSMERLHHPNIIRLYEVVETLAKLHIVMEYAGGGELFTKISNEGKFPESEAKHIFAQSVAGVQHMVGLPIHPFFILWLNLLKIGLPISLFLIHWLNLLHSTCWRLFYPLLVFPSFSPYSTCCTELDVEGLPINLFFIPSSNLLLLHVTCCWVVTH